MTTHIPDKMGGNILFLILYMVATTLETGLTISSRVSVVFYKKQKKERSVEKFFVKTLNDYLSQKQINERGWCVRTNKKTGLREVHLMKREHYKALLAGLRKKRMMEIQRKKIDHERIQKIVALNKHAQRDYVDPESLEYADHRMDHLIIVVQRPHSI